MDYTKFGYCVIKPIIMRLWNIRVILLTILFITGIAISGLAQETEEITDEEEIWNTTKNKEKKIKETVEEDEEIQPGTFEYADDEEKPKKKKKEEKIQKEEQVKTDRPASDDKITDAGATDAGINDTGTGEVLPKSTELNDTDILKLQIPRNRLTEINTLWFERSESIKRREFSNAEDRLKKIIEYKLDSGIPDIPAISLSLTIEAKNAIRAKDFLTAQRLADSALIISPDIYEIWFFNAYLYWITNKTDIMKPLQFIGGGLKRVFQDITTAPLVIGNIITLLSLIIAVTSLLFIIALILKYANSILHDFSHLFPSGRSIFLSDIFWLSIFFILVIRFFSIFHFIFISSVIMWLYLNKKEKVILIIIIIFVSSLPYNFSVYNRLLNIYRSDLQYVYKALKFEDEAATTRLMALLDSGKGGPDEYLTCGIIQKRKGEFEIAEKMYKKAIELNASNTAAYNNLGNLYLILERYDDALAQYNIALNLEPQSEIVRYNISRLFLRKKELDKSNSELLEAKTFNEEFVSLLIKRSSPGINRFIYDIEPAYNLEYSTILRGNKQQGGRMYLPFEHYITGGLLTSDVLFWLIIIGVTIIGIGLLSRYIQVSHICHRCGRPVCKTCSPELHDDNECSQCFHIFTRRDVADPKNRFLKDKEISNYQFFHNITTIILSIVIPGTLFIWDKRSIKGLIILLLSISGFISFFFFNRPNPLPYFSTSPFEMIFKSPFLLAGLTAYIINIRNCFKKE